MTSQQLRPVTAVRSARRRYRNGHAQGVIWLVVALSVIVGVGIALVWWAVHPRWTDNGYSLSHACPPLQRGAPSSPDYADAFQWNGVSYWVTRAVVPVTDLGAQVTTIDCSIAELTAPNRLGVELGVPWPDRTSTFLPSGTPVYRIDRQQTTCQLGVRVDGQAKVYAPVERKNRRC
jgi:hypothetical protein